MAVGQSCICMYVLAIVHLYIQEPYLLLLLYLAFFHVLLILHCLFQAQAQNRWMVNIWLNDVAAHPIMSAEL